MNGIDVTFCQNVSSLVWQWFPDPDGVPCMGHMYMGIIKYSHFLLFKFKTCSFSRGNKECTLSPAMCQISVYSGTFQLLDYYPNHTTAVPGQASRR